MEGAASLLLSMYMLGSGSHSVPPPVTLPILSLTHHHAGNCEQRNQKELFPHTQHSQSSWRMKLPPPLFFCSSSSPFFFPPPLLLPDLPGALEAQSIKEKLTHAPDNRELPKDCCACMYVCMYV